MPGTPFTRTCFAVEDVLKGRLPRSFVVQVIGGQLGRARSCAKPRFVKAKGAARWSFAVARRLAAGRYIVLARARDASGNLQSSPARKKLKLR